MATAVEAPPLSPYFDHIGSTIESFLPQFQFDGFTLDDRLGRRALDELIHDEALRMMHICIIEQLRVFRSKAQGWARTSAFAFLETNKFVVKPFAVPILALNDHRDPVGFLLTHGPREVVFARVVRLADRLERLYRCVNVHVRLTAPPAWTGDDVLEYVLVEFCGKWEHSGPGSIHWLYRMAIGQLHPDECKSPTPKRRRVGSTEDMEWDEDNTPRLFCADPNDWFHRIICVLQYIESRCENDTWLDVIHFCHFFLPPGDPMRVRREARNRSVVEDVITRFMFHRMHASTTIDRAALIASQRAFFVLYAFLFNDQFACFFHFNIGSAFREGPCSSPVVFRGNMDPLSEPYWASTAVINGVVAHGDLLAFPVTIGSDWCMNWATGLSGRGNDLFVPLTYWHRLRCKIDHECGYATIPFITHEREHTTTYERVVAGAVDGTVPPFSVRSTWAQYATVLENADLGLRTVTHGPDGCIVIMLKEREEFRRRRIDAMKAEPARVFPTPSIDHLWTPIPPFTDGAVMVYGTPIRSSCIMELSDIHAPAAEEFATYWPSVIAALNGWPLFGFEIV